MLSILIPTYNYNIVPLVEKLHSQAVSLLIDFEIIVIEDGSTDFLDENKKTTDLPNVKREVLPQNIGRSAIRNRLAYAAKFKNLLFMDCDAEVCSDYFIQRYLPFCTENQIVIGGTAYNPHENNPQYSLRLKYGRQREARTADKRGKNTFATFNFLISKDIFQKIRFDESINGYGYEDMIFGHKLKMLDYNFVQIDNPLIHNGLDTNNIYLAKTNEGLANLLKLYKSGNYPFIYDESKILLWYLTAKKLKITKIISALFFILKKSFLKNLSGKNPSLLLFDIYKLCLISQMK